MKRLIASLAFAAVVAPAALLAQSVTALAPVSPAPVVSTTSASPSASVRPDVAGIRVTSDANAPLVVSTAAATGLHQGEGVALMAVGGAGLVAGLLIGDSAGTAVAIGGLAVGLIGLYQYVR
ncbi:MAG: hypothetical protein ABI026_05290 [Gemmatimonadaceae bacterium]